jgi:hypothetical protein
LPKRSRKLLKTPCATIQFQLFPSRKSE